MEEKSFPKVIGLNVGGKKFTTKLSTLLKYPDSMLGAMFNGKHSNDQDSEGNYFIDRNGTYFAHILEFLRDGQYVPPKQLQEHVLKDAEFYAISELEDKLKQLPHIQISLALPLDNLNVQRYICAREDVLQLAVSNATTKVTPQCTSESTVLLIAHQKSIIKEKGPLTYKSFEDALAAMVGKKHMDNVVDICINHDEDFDNENFFKSFIENLQEEGYKVTSTVFNPNWETGLDFEEHRYTFLYGMFLKFDWNFVPHILSSQKES